MENRHLPILHENGSLSVLRVSNEPLFSWGEWAVKIVLNKLWKSSPSAGKVAMVGSYAMLHSLCGVLSWGGRNG